MHDNVDVPIHGTCAPEYAAVREAFAANFRKRGEIGAAVCVYKDGKAVVDLWGGYKDLHRKEPWQADTIVIMNSLAKSMCALSLHMLIDRGMVDFDAPAQGVLIRHILSHTCGVIYCDRATPGSWFRWGEHI